MISSPSPFTVQREGSDSAIMYLLGEMSPGASPKNGMLANADMFRDETLRARKHRRRQGNNDTSAAAAQVEMKNRSLQFFYFSLSLILLYILFQLMQ